MRVAIGAIVLLFGVIAFGFAVTSSWKLLNS